MSTPFMSNHQLLSQTKTFTPLEFEITKVKFILLIIFQVYYRSGEMLWATENPVACHQFQTPTSVSSPGINYTMIDICKYTINRGIDI